MQIQIALMIASFIGNKGIAELLINAGADLNTVSNIGLTASFEQRPYSCF